MLGGAAPLSAHSEPCSPGCAGAAVVAEPSPREELGFPAVASVWGGPMRSCPWQTGLEAQGRALLRAAGSSTWQQISGTIMSQILNEVVQ